jgi:hypothetical protein
VTAGIEIAGWSGAGLLLAAYALVSLRRLTGDGNAFQIMNILGAAGIALNRKMLAEIAISDPVAFEKIVQA